MRKVSSVLDITKFDQVSILPVRELSPSHFSWLGAAPDQELRQKKAPVGQRCPTDPVQTTGPASGIPEHMDTMNKEATDWLTHFTVLFNPI